MTHMSVHTQTTIAAENPITPPKLYAMNSAMIFITLLIDILPAYLFQNLPKFF